ncbi:MAG: Bro-N domain-containing protein [Candidatus Woesearchaeota archaeon]|jgi:hypothetical protein
MTPEKALVAFQDRKIRRAWHNDEWYYSVVDVVEALTESPSPRQYWGVLKGREIQLLTICLQLKLLSADGKYYNTDCANTKSIFRIIQSIPSPKAEPFKLWLAQLGQERIEEIRNPELAIERARRYYEIKGYPLNWILKRLPSISIRNELTDEWKSRGISKDKDFAILTDEISKTIFDASVDEHKRLKRIDKGNLRDNMVDWELLLTILGEKAAVDITVAKNSKGFSECEKSALEGAEIAKNARKELEKKIGKSTISTKKIIECKNK